jgi:NADH dehydrogenase FAD-containing subunit
MTAVYDMINNAGFEWAMQPGRSQEQILDKLHFAVVGGGPTGIEFAAELHDFITQDLSRLYPSLMDKVRMSVYDVAGKILSSFDSNLSEYTTQRFARGGINIKTGIHVVEVQKNALILKGNVEEPFGCLVWATGIGPTSLVEGLDLPHDRARRLITDDHLRLMGKDDKPIPNVYALGDCATIKGHDLPATAQVAQQKGKYLAKGKL